MRWIKKIVVFVAFISCPALLFGQKKLSRKEYIEKYKNLAIKEMKRSGIPASITLAQGILESNNGNSRLAVKANNHFGIKCHSDWKGKRIHHDDDRRNECFRKYKHPEDSYHDHSNFLTSTSRYSDLFKLKPTDYKSWARGLKKAGYATSRTYARDLVRLIEENNLYQYDIGGGPKFSHKKEKPVLYQKKATSKNTGETFEVELSTPRIKENNGVEYITVKLGETFFSLSKELEMMQWELYKYNDLGQYDELHEGQTLYLQPKRRKAARGLDYHTVKEGETLYSISQKYAVKIKRLEKMNKISIHSKLSPGTIINLRRKKR